MPVHLVAQLPDKDVGHDHSQVQQRVQLSYDLGPSELDQIDLGSLEALGVQTAWQAPSLSRSSPSWWS